MDRPHLGRKVLQEEHLAVADRRQSAGESRPRARAGDLVLDRSLGGLPVHAVRRVGQAVVERLTGEQVLRERVAEPDVGGVLVADDHVGLADRIRLVVDLLAVELEPRVGVQPGMLGRADQVLLGEREHAARACRRVVDRAYDVLLGQRPVVAGEQQVDHEPDRVARCEVLPGGLVRGLRELADQLLEQVSHLGVADRVGVQVDLGELLYDDQQPVLLRQRGDLVVEPEPVEDVDVLGKARDVVSEVGGQSVRVARQLREAPRAGVVEGQVGRALDPVGAQLLARLAGGDVPHFRSGGGEDAVEPTQDRHWQDHAAVLMGLVDTPQLICDRPDEVAEVAQRRSCRTGPHDREPSWARLRGLGLGRVATSLRAGA